MKKLFITDIQINLRSSRSAGHKPRCGARRRTPRLQRTWCGECRCAKPRQRRPKDTRPENWTLLRLNRLLARRSDQAREVFLETGEPQSKRCSERVNE
jgi:hypothetical protein